MKSVLKLLKKAIKNIYFWLFIIFIGLSFVLFPLKNLIFSKLWFSKTIVIFTNEAEIRPCGGFFSVIGESKNFPFDLAFKNVYALPKFQKKKVPEKLKNITDVYNFWDSGISADSKICTSVVKNFYNDFSQNKTENVVLVNYSVLEQILAVIGDIKINDTVINHKNIFRFLSESVANVDRHSIKDLGERKNILKPVISGIIKKSILNPFKWRILTNTVNQLVQQGDIYINNISNHIDPENSFGILEWNLGGGKTSRFLQKKLDIFLREIKPNTWKLFVQVDIKNTLGVSEPFGQTWKGGIEVLFPKNIAEKVYLKDLEIKPGQRYWKQFEFEFYKKDLDEFFVFSPRGQKTNFSGIVSVFPQQEILDSNGDILDFTTEFNTVIRNGKKQFFWKKAKDIQSPFITFHERIFYQDLPLELQEIFEKDDFLVEIHTNESVKVLSNFSVILTDTGAVNVFENRKFKKIKKISENAFLLAFEKNTDQIGEFFELDITGLQDLWGNNLFKKIYTVGEKKRKTNS